MLAERCRFEPAVSLRSLSFVIKYLRRGLKEECGSSFGILRASEREVCPAEYLSDVNRRKQWKRHASELRALPSRLTDTGPVRIRTSGIRLAWVGQICTSGYFRHAHSNGPLAPMVAQRGSMTTSRPGVSRTLAPVFSEETCSDRFAVPGPT